MWLFGKRGLDIRDVLENEHSEVRELIEQLQACGPGAKASRKKLFAEIKTALLTHAKAEERCVYSKLKKDKNEEARSEAIEGKEEHEIIESLLMKISRISAGDHEKFGTSVKVLKEMVEHHVNEEEDEMFSSLKKDFSAAQREKMANEFLHVKRQLEPRIARVGRGAGVGGRVARGMMRKTPVRTYERADVRH